MVCSSALSIECRRKAEIILHGDQLRENIADSHSMVNNLYPFVELDFQ